MYFLRKIQQCFQKTSLFIYSGSYIYINILLKRQLVFSIFVIKLLKNNDFFIKMCVFFLSMCVLKNIYLFILAVTYKKNGIPKKMDDMTCFISEKNGFTALFCISSKVKNIDIF